VISRAEFADLKKEVARLEVDEAIKDAGTVANP